MKVAIVVDPECPILEKLTATMPVWAVDSPTHRATAEFLWKSIGAATTDQGITVFRANDFAATEENCLGIIDMVVLHHEGRPPGSHFALEVIGTELTAKLRDELQTYGFVNFKPTNDGFVASL